jgi:hypothetical protein
MNLSSFSDLRLHLSSPLNSSSFIVPERELGLISFQPASSPAEEEVMKSGNWKIVPVLSALALATMVAPYAHAGCGLRGPAPHGASWQPQIGFPRLVPASFTIDDEADKRHESSIVGTWKERWVEDDGTVFDASYSQWHSDGTEINVSGLRAPLTGDVCLGEWIQTGPRTYQLNHFGISYDPTGQTLVGPARIQQWLTLDPTGNSTSGKFTVVQWDETGKVLAQFEGKVTGTRVTMETGFESVE